MTKIIALFNQAGGVGKSTLTQNLGYHLRQQDHRVLLVDMDPQASLTTFMGLPPEELESTVADALLAEEPIEAPLHQDIRGLDLLPANINLSAVELNLVTADLRDFRLQEVLEPLKSNYDFILIDCPPSLGLLSYISLVAATHILVPIQCQFKAFAGANLLIDTFTRVKRRANRQLAFAGFVPTHYDVRRTQDGRTLEAIQERFQGVAPVYPPIPSSTAFADAVEATLPLALYDKNHKALSVLEQISQGLAAL